MNKGICQNTLNLLGVTENAKSSVTQTLKVEKSELLGRHLTSTA